MRNEVQPGGLTGARFVDPVVLARVGNLELVARSVVDGFINGMHRSPYFGASVDFAEHRGYTPGDDIRSLAHPVLRHRVLTNFRAESEGVTTDSIIDELLSAVPVPKSGM